MRTIQQENVCMAFLLAACFFNTVWRADTAESPPLLRLPSQPFSFMEYMEPDQTDLEALGILSQDTPSPAPATSPPSQAPLPTSSGAAAGDATGEQTAPAEPPGNAHDGAHEEAPLGVQTPPEVPVGDTIGQKEEDQEAEAPQEAVNPPPVLEPIPEWTPSTPSPGGEQVPPSAEAFPKPTPAQEAPPPWLSAVLNEDLTTAAGKQCAELEQHLKGYSPSNPGGLPEELAPRILAILRQMDDLKKALGSILEHSDKEVLKSLFSGAFGSMPDDAFKRWTVNVVLKFPGNPKGEGLSLITPVWMPMLKQTEEYVNLIKSVLKARMKQPAWEQYVGGSTLFSQAHRAIVNVIEFTCGDNGVFNYQQQHCHMTINGAVVGRTYAIQLMIDGLAVEDPNGRPETGTWLDRAGENFYLESMQIGVSALPTSMLQSMDYWLVELSQKLQQPQARPVVGESTQTLFMRVKEDNPDLFRLCREFLGWPETKTRIESEEEANLFNQALASAGVFTNQQNLTWVTNAAGNEGAPIGRHIIQQHGESLPPEAREYVQNSVRQQPPEKATVEKAGMPWELYRGVVQKRHGPITNLPTWVAVSDSCPIPESKEMGGKYMDLTKVSRDVVMRLSFHARELIERSGKPDSSHFAALCSSMGVFIAAWQQQMEMTFVEAPAAHLAHAELIEKIRNLHKYFLYTPNDLSLSEKNDEASWGQDRQILKNFATGVPAKECASLINAGGRVATQPYTGGSGMKRKARSLYGAIANTLGVPMTFPHLAKGAFMDLVTTKLLASPWRKRKHNEKTIIGLCAALQVSAFLHKCSHGSSHELGAALFHSHLDGRKLSEHFMQEAREPLTKFQRVYALCDPSSSTQIFESVLQDLLAVVSPVWEERDMFRNAVPGTSRAGSTESNADRSPKGGNDEETSENAPANDLPPAYEELPPPYSPGTHPSVPPPSYEEALKAPSLHSTTNTDQAGQAPAPPETNPEGGDQPRNSLYPPLDHLRG